MQNLEVKFFKMQLFSPQCSLFSPGMFMLFLSSLWVFFFPFLISLLCFSLDIFPPLIFFFLLLSQLGFKVSKKKKNDTFTWTYFDKELIL